MPVDQVIGKSLPRLPIEVGLLPHWLVVDGVQPQIPENAALERPRARKRARSVGRPPKAPATPAAPAPGRQLPAGEAEAVDGSIVRAPVKHVLSQVRWHLVHHVAVAIVLTLARAVQRRTCRG